LFSILRIFEVRKMLITFLTAPNAGHTAEDTRYRKQ
jgi:hypothetical protein